MAKFQIVKSLGTMSSKAIHSISNLVKNGAKPIAAKSTKILPHIHRFDILMVEAVKKKAEYAPDIVAMHKQGLNTKYIAKVLGMSESYCRKLLKSAIAE